jgi:hypothetical protein
VIVLALEAEEIISMLGRRVRVRNGVHTFEGRLQGPSERKFPRGPNRSAYGFVVEGTDFQLDFAWWDWDIRPLGNATA